MEQKMRWPWRKQQKQQQQYEGMMPPATVSYVWIMVNLMFLASPPDQQAWVKEALRKLVAEMSAIHPASFSPEQAQAFRDVLSALFQVTISLRPDQQDIAAGIDKVLERLNALSRDMGKAAGQQTH
jgi:hypothetical protein